MRKSLYVLLIISIITVSLCSCNSFGKKHITDVSKYGEVEDYIDFPEFFPETIEDYTVNSYSYTVYSYMDVCYEIFLDITVTEKQFDELISKAKKHTASMQEKEAYYAKGYYEIVFIDDYSIDTDKTESNVLNARIDKIIYNPDTYNIVFESFDAFDTGVYPLNEVAYFNRFNIDQFEYKESLDK